MTTTEKDLPLRFVQIGDLHLTDRNLQNHRDFIRIVDELNRNMGGFVDFVFLPGDNADDGTDEQFALVRGGLNDLRLPWHAIPGDHDFKPRSLDSFYRGLRVRQLPYAEDVRGCTCLFLDVVSQGSGGPDFRLGAEQMTWLEAQLAHARHVAKPCVIMMHAYPADLGEEATTLTRLIDDSSTALVVMGHTHYNEISHDGRTIYAATRSTGQIEEGPVGFSIAAVDRGVVSWRFKTLDSAWPFVMITSPPDKRLAMDTAPASEIRAAAWGAAPIRSADVRVDESAWQPMKKTGGNLFSAAADLSGQRRRIEVRVTDDNGNTGSDTIEIDAARASERTSLGSDRNAIGAWPERHLMGTQLGPNRNGRKW